MSALVRRRNLARRRVSKAPRDLRGHRCGTRHRLTYEISGSCNRNGSRGVHTEVERASFDKIILADDDIRYTVSSIATIAKLLDGVTYLAASGRAL